ncbi:MAG: hypothetical protein MJ144_03640 [Clostridia bacterium]|nr:hypothetical protein [Clostridia bacterium]
MKDDVFRSCVDCKSCGCNDGGFYPEFCMSKKYSMKDEEGSLVREETRKLYQEPDNKRIAVAARSRWWSGPLQLNKYYSQNAKWICFCA